MITPTPFVSWGQEPVTFGYAMAFFHWATRADHWHSLVQHNLPHGWACTGCKTDWWDLQFHCRLWGPPRKEPQ